MLLEDGYLCQNFLGGSGGIPTKIAMIIGIAYRVVQVLIPILLIIWGMLDLGKAVMAQKEDEIKKGQQTFIKRLVAAAIVFFVTSIVYLLIAVLADSGNSSKISGCVRSVLACTSSSCADLNSDSGPEE